MSRKILFVCGSPRKKGNTNTLVARAVEAARDAGAQVDVLDVTKLEYAKPGCTACMGCRSAGDFHCVLNDELAHHVASLPTYDVVVLASPLYFWSFSAQMKGFVDRMYSLFKYDAKGITSAMEGKTLALLATSGGMVEDNLEVLEHQMKLTCRWIQCEYKSLLVPLAPNKPGDYSDNPQPLEDASQFGRDLATG